MSLSTQHTADLYCHGTQTMHCSRVCHCLLSVHEWDELTKANFVRHKSSLTRGHIGTQTHMQTVQSIISPVKAVTCETRSKVPSVKLSTGMYQASHSNHELNFYHLRVSFVHGPYLKQPQPLHSFCEQSALSAMVHN